MKKLLILGVNGFIGHHLSEAVVRETDWDVYGMDLESDRLANVLDHPRFHFFEGDITINREWVSTTSASCDTVLPLVAIATPATYIADPLRVFELDFEANPATDPPVREASQAGGVSLDFGDLWHVPGGRNFIPTNPRWCWARCPNRAGSTPAASNCSTG